MERIGHFIRFFMLVQHLFAQEARERVADYGCNASAEDTETKDELGRYR